MLVYQSLDCFVVVVICGSADNGSVRHWVLCVFFRKYMCGVDVLDKGCGGIHVQVYVGCRVFEVVKSYLCVSGTIVEPLSALFMMIVSWMISFFRADVSLYVRSLSAFLLSACMSVWSMPSICM